MKKISASDLATLHRLIDLGQLVVWNPNTKSFDEVLFATRNGNAAQLNISDETNPEDVSVYEVAK